MKLSQLICWWSFPPTCLSAKPPASSHKWYCSPGGTVCWGFASLAQAFDGCIFRHLKNSINIPKSFTTVFSFALEPTIICVFQLITGTTRCPLLVRKTFFNTIPRVGVMNLPVGILDFGTHLVRFTDVLGNRTAEIVTQRRFILQPGNENHFSMDLEGGS